MPPEKVAFYFSGGSAGGTAPSSYPPSAKKGVEGV